MDNTICGMGGAHFAAAAVAASTRAFPEIFLASQKNSALKNSRPQNISGEKK